MVGTRSTTTVVKHGTLTRCVYVATCVSSNLLAILSVTSSKWVSTRERLDLKTDYVLGSDDGSGGRSVDCPEGGCFSNSSDLPPTEMNISATIGLWKICYYSQGLPDVHCNAIDYKEQAWGPIHSEEDAITIYIARGVRRSAFTALLGVATLVVASTAGLTSLFRNNQHLGIVATSLTITAAMFQFATMIIFLGGVQGEAALAPPVKPNGEAHVFVYWYEWSFHMLIASYLIANLTAVLGIDINIRWYKHVGQQVKAVEPETEGDLILFNESAVSYVPERHECAV